ncbi:hypothetical protein H4R33_000621 [Dimargaris cristalligena]|nr:hypothetical protein H4R33_000621 [Dimargaris cristalligena]
MAVMTMSMVCTIKALNPLILGNWQLFVQTIFAKYPGLSEQMETTQTTPMGTETATLVSLEKATDARLLHLFPYLEYATNDGIESLIALWIYMYTGHPWKDGRELAQHLRSPYVDQVQWFRTARPFLVLRKLKTLLIESLQTATQVVVWYLIYGGQSEALTRFIDFNVQWMTQKKRLHDVDPIFLFNFAVPVAIEYRQDGIIRNLAGYCDALARQPKRISVVGFEAKWGILKYRLVNWETLSQLPSRFNVYRQLIQSTPRYQGLVDIVDNNFAVRVVEDILP